MIEVLGTTLSTPPQLIQRFRTEHPDIDLRVRPPAVDYDDLTQRLLRDNIAGSLPDVIFQGYNRSALTAQRGLATPLEPLLNADKDWAKHSYQPASDALCRYGNRTYGLPNLVSVPIVYYNVDLVKQAGGDPNRLPQTWEQISNLAARITALDGKRVGGFFDYASPGNWTFMALVDSQGSRMMSPDDRKIAFDGPEGMRALNVLKMFGAAGQVDMSRDQAYQAFSTGGMGLIVTSSGFLKSLMKQAKFEVRTAPLPLASNGHLPAGGNCLMMLTKDTGKQQAAWTFMKFMAGSTAQKTMFESTGYVPGNRLTVAQLEQSTDAKDPRMTALLASSKSAGWYSFPGKNSLRITEAIALHLQEVVTLKRSPEEAMKLMVNDVQNLLAR
ncbi:ABC transporter substrate-binding protein [Paraburkholderia aspalathi]|uniref:Carbohydrate ABC transporter substrate-binding protein, CUT1 family n=1 Tax=Paraburkholderia aspalathi TaxID=1324617 RepID=A0A1I7BCJ9_9BURK|nr:ABC transporter substrate-binding protein [Paraburkholderia aspalathi]SFT84939.1 carbohydrate ABC transporter substrate-binding protein, CUT1 family [Paraburkholderia aspalathi]